MARLALIPQLVRYEDLNTALGMVLVASGGISVCGTSTRTLVQRIVDDDKRGRVMSLWGLIFRGAPSLGVLAMGTASE